MKIELIVRDTCRLRPDLAGVSENVRVVSVVGRYLEHGRIYYFRNGGREEYFIGSADCMKRNLESRVEVVAPVEDPNLRKELRRILDLQLAPNRNQWEMKSDGSYERRPCPDNDSGCQQALIDLEDVRRNEETKTSKRRRKGFARRVLKAEPRSDA